MLVHPGEHRHDLLFWPMPSSTLHHLVRRQADRVNAKFRTVSPRSRRSTPLYPLVPTSPLCLTDIFPCSPLGLGRISEKCGAAADVRERLLVLLHRGVAAGRRRTAINVATLVVELFWLTPMSLGKRLASDPQAKPAGPPRRHLNRRPRSPYPDSHVSSPNRRRRGLPRRFPGDGPRVAVQNAIRRRRVPLIRVAGQGTGAQAGSSRRSETSRLCRTVHIARAGRLRW